ncbi:low molecular weight phosphotyrosine protein phosphatase [Kitasatospora sp. NPDC056181]|uniref:arsenate reductase/protein-tyrosine-phosphatase family protein n=1 Tax=Kitasatospora sp. NPDC056181 TaxID=3345737 RepID=UPI0035DAFAFB
MTNPTPDTPVRARRILTVCLGNYCRSPLAGAVLATKAGPALDIRTAGLIDMWVGKAAHPDMITAAAHLGYDLTDHHPTQVDRALITWADLVLAMDHSVLDQLRPIAGPRNEHKLRLYLADGSDVPDPMGKGPEEFAASAAIIEAGAAPYLP